MRYQRPEAELTLRPEMKSEVINETFSAVPSAQVVKRKTGWILLRNSLTRNPGELTKGQGHRTVAEASRSALSEDGVCGTVREEVVNLPSRCRSSLIGG